MNTFHSDEDTANDYRRDAFEEDVLEGATIEDATITDSVIFPETTIKHSELRRSLIDTDTHLESLNLSGAVIGAHTQLNGD